MIPRKKNIHLKSMFLCTALLTVIVFLSGLSCSDVPSLADIKQLNDRTPPVFNIEYPSDGEIYGEIVRVKGKVIDEQWIENQAERIDTVTYRINENAPEILISISEGGSFLVSFSTFHFSGNISLLFKATDISGNTGTKNLFLISSPNTPEPEATPTPTPALPVSDYPPGTLWFVPDELHVSPGTNFTTEIHLNSGTQYLAAYGMTVFYNISNINVNPTLAYNGTEAGPDGFVSATNMNTAGVIVLSGFDASGRSPCSDLHILSMHWCAYAPGNTYFSIAVDNLWDDSCQTIGTPQGIGCMVIVE